MSTKKAPSKEKPKQSLPINIPAFYYQPVLYAGRNSGGLALIYIFAKDNNTKTAQINFVGDGDDVPPPSVDDSGVVILSYPISMLAGVLELLRTRQAQLSYGGPTNSDLEAIIHLKGVRKK